MYIKKLSAVLATAILLTVNLSTSVFALSWAEETPLDQTTDDAAIIDVETDAATGDIHVLSIKMSPPNISNLYYQKWNQGTQQWGTEIDIWDQAEDFTVDATNPVPYFIDMELDSTGDPNIIWSDGADGTRDLWFWSSDEGEQGSGGATAWEGVEDADAISTEATQVINDTQITAVKLIIDAGNDKPHIIIGHYDGDSDDIYHAECDGCSDENDATFDETEYDDSSDSTDFSANKATSLSGEMFTNNIFISAVIDDGSSPYPVMAWNNSISFAGSETTISTDVTNTATVITLRAESDSVSSVLYLKNGSDAADVLYYALQTANATWDTPIALTGSINTTIGQQGVRLGDDAMLTTADTQVAVVAHEDVALADDVVVTFYESTDHFASQTDTVIDGDVTGAADIDDVGVIDLFGLVSGDSKVTLAAKYTSGASVGKLYQWTGTAVVSGVPEFSTYVYCATILAGFGLLYQRNPEQFAWMQAK
jgi:hypothetical protein